MPDRDRDGTGRARSARPRDATGRPLPRSAAGVPRRPDELQLTPAQALAEADRLLAADLPFQAHDVFEDLWKRRRAQGAPDAAMWQGLAQLCVGLTHLQRGNRTGAATLLRRGAENLDAFAGTSSPIAVPALIAWARDAARAVESGATEVPAPPTVAAR